MKKILAGALLLSAHYAGAAQLVAINIPAESSTDVYLSSTGVDTGSCTKSAPCKTPLFAMQKAGGGRNAWCSTGTYQLPSAITGIASGTASTPIFFGASAGQNCTFNIGAGGVRLDGASYWTFHNATYNAVDRGFVFGLTNGLPASSHIQFYKNTLKQTVNADSICGPANCGLIYVEPINSNPDYFDIVQNDIHAAGTGSTNENNGGLFFFRYPMHMNILGNTIHDIPDAIRYKFDHNATLAGQVAITIANNIIWNGDLNSQASWAQIYNNVFANRSILLGNNGGIQGGKYSTLSHNTLHSQMVLIAPGGDPSCNVCYVTLKNNVFSGTPPYQQLQILPWASGDVKTSHNYNYWPSGAKILTNSLVTSVLQLTTGVSLEPNGAAASATYSGNVNSYPYIAANWSITNPVKGDDGLSMGAIAANLLTTNSLGSSGTAVPTSPPSAPSLQVAP